MPLPDTYMNRASDHTLDPGHGHILNQRRSGQAPHGSILHIVLDADCGCFDTIDGWLRVVLAVCTRV